MAPDMPLTAHKAIVHPGILQTRSNLTFMKSKIRAGEEPWKAAWDRWIAKPVSSLDFKPEPYPHIIRGASGASQKGGSELMASAAAASSHANQWVVTGNEAHAQKVIEIFDTWSAVLADFCENDAMLIAGWTGGEFANAAEILRATYPPWKEESQAGFKRMLLTVYVPLMRAYYPEANGNWDAAMMFSLAAIGVFCENRQLIDAACHHYRFGPVNSGITRYIYPSGQCEETTRDQGHVQIGLGYFAKTATVAWNQGVDLFGEADNRLALGYEYTSRLLLGESVPVYGKIVDVRNRFTDVYETVLQHYRYVKRIEMPFTERAAVRARESSRGVVMFFQGPLDATSAATHGTPVPCNIASHAGAQAQASGAAPISAAYVTPGQSIQEAIDKLAVIGGGTISLALGVHVLTATLRIPSNTSVVGTGRDCEVILDKDSKVGETAIANCAPDVHDVILRDFVVEGGEAPHAPIDPNADVQRRRLMRGPIRSGILFQSDEKKGIRNIRLEHITVRNCTGSAVEFFGTNHVEIVNCDFAASGGLVPPGPGKNHNLKLHHVTDLSVTGSRMVDSMWGSGISLGFGHRVSVRNCELSRNQGCGIAIAESDHVTVEECLAEGNTNSAVSQEIWMDPNHAVFIKNLKERNNGT
jgi:parallel beta-helix repeat protein